MKAQEDFAPRWERSVQANYGAPLVTFVKAKGSIITDSSGKKYLDFLGGIATSALGHANPAIVEAVSNQISVLSHVSNFYMHPKVIELAEKLQELTGDSNARTFFCNSGAEANEAALKLSRRTGRIQIVATQGAFHGRTMGALSLTGQPAKRDPFLPLLPGIVHVPFGDLAAMRVSVTKKTAMVIIEPILGEAGVVMPPIGYLRGIRDICDRTGTLMVIDCVQTGMGRTGVWFGYESEGILPDVITLAKGLGGGLPLGAMIALGNAAKLFKPGDHGSTFGGNPVCCASALATIREIEDKNLLGHVSRYSKFLKTSLASCAGVKEVRGAGFLIGIVLKRKNAVELRDLLQARGILVNATIANVIRIAPPLNVTKSQITTFLKEFEIAAKGVNRGTTSRA